jgi:hypothetical protein
MRRFFLFPHETLAAETAAIIRSYKNGIDDDSGSFEIFPVAGIRHGIERVQPQVAIDSFDENIYLVVRPRASRLHRGLGPRPLSLLAEAI